MKFNNYAASLLIFAVFGCGKKDKDSSTQVEQAPNVCKALAVMGTFPVNGQPNVETYGIACFEGYQVNLEKKFYPASLKCGEAKLAVAQGDDMAKKHYEPIESKSCPTDNVIATCDMGTAKTLVYKGSEEFFKNEAFEAYCSENKGTALYN